jgi:hypothetical protein
MKELRTELPLHLICVLVDGELCSPFPYFVLFYWPPFKLFYPAAPKQLLSEHLISKKNY